MADPETFEYLYKTYFGEGAREQDELDRLPGLLADVELFIDVGASLGQYTFHANEAMDGGRIIAIEADPERFAELERNCAEWAARSTNEITVLHAACGDSHDPVQFWFTGTQISGGLFPVPERSDDYRPVEVTQVMLDDFHEEGCRAVVKVDVEGAELRVLRGGERFLRDGSTRFLIEATWYGDRDRRTTSLDLLRYLRRMGMTIRKHTPRRTANYLVEPADGGRATWSFVQAMPLLLAKSVYGRMVPTSVRTWRERRLNERRRRSRDAQPGQAA